MTQQTIKLYVGELYSKKSRKNYPTNKIDVYHIDDIWNLDILDLKDYGEENNTGYRYVSVVIDNFSKFGWTTPLKKKNGQKTKSSEITLRNSKRKPNLLECDRGKEFYNKIFQKFVNKNKFKVYSRNTSLGAVYAEPFNRTIRDLLKRPLSEMSDANWIDVLPTITKQNNNRVHTSTKLTPTEARLKKNEGFFYKNLFDKRNKIKPKFQVNDLVRVADWTRTFSKGDTIRWFYKLYQNTETKIDTIPSNRLDNLP